MKIIMYTLAYGDWTIRKANVTNPFKETYCMLHGYEYHYVESSKMPVRHPFWKKIEKGMELLDKCDVLAYLDADAAPVEFEKKMEDFLPDRVDLALCKDVISLNGEPWYFNTGVFLLRNNEWGHRLLMEWNKEDPISSKHDLHDQTRLNLLYKQNWNDIRNHTKLFEKCTMQSTNAENWRPGCFIKHCAASRNPREDFKAKFWKGLDADKFKRLGV